MKAGDLLRRLRILVGTRIGLRLLGRSWAVQFGVLSGVAQLYLTFWPDAPLPRTTAFAAIAGVALVGGAATALPRNRVRREFSHPDFAVTVEVGDLFEQPGHLVVGFSDTFDTDTASDLLVVGRSVQGQLLNRVFGGDVARLDALLAQSLRGVRALGTEPRSAKPQGNRVRYPLGTVAVVEEGARCLFCVAYGRMSNDLVVDCDVRVLWDSLAALWESVRVRSHREPLAMAVVGSDLARINSMDHAGLLRLILLSFVTRSREGVVCSELTVVVHPRDYRRINMLELDVFLRSL
ncbi:macro domain-containing protein [Streptacidiphilus jiangxiensis]|uniref:Thoeris protein ThsA Macro domain-containing protein n=1 Tax=Streptacidiphilus jiangxiensis TaxID=235985 RepID=A0A1H7I212_STRJI|nr:macro domain-containing protein [Streptacidiphilus jiangxiensis]SEK54545.1 hypothetical protein SAMN05414137_102387 [Streptacidiphilus jiangxiensis]